MTTAAEKSALRLSVAALKTRIDALVADAAAPVPAPPPPAPAPAPAGVYEAEAGTFGGGSEIQNASAASGGKDVGLFPKAGSFTQVTVHETGAASLVIRYANGFGSDARASLYLNGTKHSTITFAPTGGWNNFANTSVAVTLAAPGAVRLQMDVAENSPDIDTFTVMAGTPSPAPTPPPPPPPASPTLAWDPVASASSYTLKWGTATRNYTASKIVGNATQQLLSALALVSGTRYFMAVLASNAKGDSPPSNEIQILDGVQA